MNKLPHNSDFLSAELLRKYRDDTLSPEEAQQVARLRDDPFHTDALAGVEQLPDGETFTRQTADLAKAITRTSASAVAPLVYSIRRAHRRYRTALAGFFLFDLHIRYPLNH